MANLFVKISPNGSIIGGVTPGDGPLDATVQYFPDSPLATQLPIDQPIVVEPTSEITNQDT